VTAEGSDYRLHGVRIVHANELDPNTPQTPGMNRALAFELPLLWAGQVVTEPGAVSGWHHHERNESSLYIVRGVLRLECEGHDGYLDAGPGDFVHADADTDHGELWTDEGAQVILIVPPQEHLPASILA